jgi:hypothetical protein
VEKNCIRAGGRIEKVKLRERPIGASPAKIYVALSLPADNAGDSATGAFDYFMGKCIPPGIWNFL